MKNKSASVQALYDRIAGNYDDMITRTGYIGPAWLMENLQAGYEAEGLNVLDIGCGNGVNVRNLHTLNPTIQATGIDISAQMIAEAGKSGLYQTLIEQSLDLPLPIAVDQNESFDLIIALGCLEFVNEIDLCLSEISRLSRPGAQFYLSLQRYEPDNPAAPRRMNSGDVIHFAYTKKEMGEMLENAGFQPLHSEDQIGYTGGAPAPYTFVIGEKLKT